jgi:hypothetical protein
VLPFNYLIYLTVSAGIRLALHESMDDPSARRSAAIPGPATAAPARIKRLTLDLPEGLHRAIKVSAAQDGVTMAEKLRALLLKHYGLDS